MKRLILILILFGGLVACRSHKETIVPPEKIVTHIERITEVRLDTAFIEVPAQSSEKLTADTISHLETDFATSDARINPDGTLYHNLSNKPGKKPAIVPTTVQRIDSIVERKVPVPVYMDKPPNKADQFKIDVFWWLIGIIVALSTFDNHFLQANLLSYQKNVVNLHLCEGRTGMRIRRHKMEN